MAKPTQQELMAAHSMARNSALESGVPANGNGGSKNLHANPLNPQSPQEAGTIRKVGVGPATPEVVQKATLLLDQEHPFSGNRNNQRVAERIAAQNTTGKKTIAVKTPAEAALEALTKTAAHEEANPNDFVDTSDEALDAASKATIAGALTTAPTVLQPIVPSSTTPVGDANVSAVPAQAEQDAATAAAVAAAAGGAPAIPAAPAPVVPPIVPPVIPPVVPPTA